MSRTDKDMPGFARATWWAPQHYRCGNPPDGLWWWGYWTTGGYRACDLPDRPVRQFQQWRRPPHCHWSPVEETGRYRCPYYSQRSPSREDRRVHYWGPQRRAARDDLRMAAAQYRARGEVDVEPDVGQHRHGVSAWF